MIFHRNDVTFIGFHRKRCKITAFFWIDQIIGAFFYIFATFLTPFYRMLTPPYTSLTLIPLKK